MKFNLAAFGSTYWRKNLSISFRFGSIFSTYWSTRWSTLLFICRFSTFISRVQLSVEWPYLLSHPLLTVALVILWLDSFAWRCCVQRREWLWIWAWFVGVYERRSDLRGIENRVADSSRYLKSKHIWFPICVFGKACWWYYYTISLIYLFIYVIIIASY